MKVLSATEARRKLPKLWKIKGKTITLFLDFDKFPTCIKFIDEVAVIAEKAQHHPDMQISWKRLNLTLTTHDAGGLTTNDTKTASKINVIVKKYSKRIVNLKD